MADAKKDSTDIPEAVLEAAREAAAAVIERGVASSAPEIDALQHVAMLNHIEFGSKRHEQILSAAYDGLTREKAEMIIKERGEDPKLWPYEKFEQAQAFLRALDTKPHAVATNPAWKRTEVG